MGAKHKQKERDNPDQRVDVLLEDAVEEYCRGLGFTVVRGRSFPDLILEDQNTWIEVKNFRANSKWTENDLVKVSKLVDGQVVSDFEGIASRIDDCGRIMSRLAKEVGCKEVPEGVHLLVLISSPPYFELEEFEDEYLREFLVGPDLKVHVRAKDLLPEALPANVSGIILWEDGHPKGYRNTAVWKDVPERIVEAFNFDRVQH